MSSATLNGQVNSHDFPIRAFFEWGLTTSYGFTTPPVEDFGKNSGLSPVSYVLTGLSGSTTYHYRAAITYFYGNKFGADMQFTTPGGGGGGPCNSPPVVPDCPCDLGTDVDTLVGTAQPNDSADAQVDFTEIAGSYKITYMSGAHNALTNCPFDSNSYVIYAVESYHCGGGFFGYTIKFNDGADPLAETTMFFDQSLCDFGAAYGSDFEPGSGAPAGCPLTTNLADFEALVKTDPLQPRFVDHFGGVISLAYVKSYTLGAGDAGPPEWEYRRIKQAVIEPSYSIRVNSTDYAALTPVLVDADATTAAPAAWDSQLTNFNRPALFDSWYWISADVGTATINNQLIDNSTRLEHNTSAQPTITGCAWIFAIQFDGASGASWVGYGGNGFTPEGVYVFSTDLFGWTLAHNLGHVVAATDAALPPNVATSTTLTASVNSVFPTIDGIALSLNDRLLVKTELNQANNGIYTVTDEGSGSTPWVLTRSADADQDAEIIQGIFVQADNGTANDQCFFRLTSPTPATLGVTNLVFTRIPPTLNIETF